MNKPPLQCKLPEVMGGELRSTIRPKNIWNSCSAKRLSQCCGDLRCGGVVCHRNNVRPVSVATCEQTSVSNLAVRSLISLYV